MQANRTTRMQDLKARTKKFALDVIRYSRKLPRGDEFTIIRRQVIRLSELATREHPELKRLLGEADELVAILTTSRRNARL